LWEWCIWLHVVALAGEESLRDAVERIPSAEADPTWGYSVEKEHASI
jgi:hypothetical protein